MQATTDAPPELPPLAIVIPAYKARHLPRALESLAAQTDRRFVVYLGDDASPEPLADIARTFENRLCLRYRRFSENLGGTSLIAQWSRCIALTEGQPWLWMFSDDDELEAGAVAALYQALQQAGGIDLLRFQIDIINDRGEVQFRPAEHPVFEREEALLQALLTDRARQWRAPDHVFSRRAYETLGGFVDHPRAMYSDYATWLKFSSITGVRTIEGARVRWRTHPGSICTSTFGAGRGVRFDALLAYFTWLRRWCSSRAALQPVYLRHGRTALTSELGFYVPPCTARECFAAWRFLRDPAQAGLPPQAIRTASRLAGAWILSRLRSRGWLQRMRAWRQALRR